MKISYWVNCATNKIEHKTLWLFNCNNIQIGFEDWFLFWLDKISLHFGWLIIKWGDVEQ